MKITAKDRSELIEILRQRFETNPQRHKALSWSAVIARLDKHPEKIRSLMQMEASGGEPDVTGHDKKTGAVVFTDCSPESPTGRRSVCYDREGLESRKEHKPATTAVDMAAAMGITLLSEDDYLALQTLGEFDAKTSSWIATPEDFRKRGGALWGGRSYGRVFIGCNGAQSYYAARGFRGMLVV